MAVRKMSPFCPKVAKAIDKAYEEAKPGRLKTHLLVIKLTASQQHTSAEIAEQCEMSRAKVFMLIKAVRERGLEALTNYLSKGRPKSWHDGISPEAMKEFARKRAGGELRYFRDALLWFEREHKIKISRNRLWYLKKKAKEMFEKPRSKRSRKNQRVA